jgi:hypothetical protein
MVFHARPWNIIHGLDTRPWAWTKSETISSGFSKNVGFELNAKE